MARAPFSLQAPFEPAGDQPKAIAELTAGLDRGDRFQTLLGVTGSGKTMTMAQRHRQARASPTLVLSHNKTLAAQLYGELKSFFPHNAVEYFISYYDYYQPEAYVPSTRHVHREGRVDQRGHRPAAAARDVDPDGARRRHHRRHGVARSTASATRSSTASRWCTLQRGAEDRARRRSSRALVRIQYSPQRRRVRARHVPRARRHGRDLPGLRGAGRARRAVGRRDRAHLARSTRSPARRSRRSSARRSIPAKHFVTERPDARARGRSDPRRAGGAARASCGTRASCSRRSGSSRARTSTSR